MVERFHCMGKKLATETQRTNHVKDEEIILYRCLYQKWTKKNHPQVQMRRNLCCTMWKTNRNFFKGRQMQAPLLRPCYLFIMLSTLWLHSREKLVCKVNTFLINKSFFSGRLALNMIQRSYPAKLSLLKYIGHCRQDCNVFGREGMLRNIEQINHNLESQYTDMLIYCLITETFNILYSPISWNNEKHYFYYF